MTCRSTALNSIDFSSISIRDALQACLFVMVSPDASNLPETVSTLQFGSNAQQVQLGQAKKNVIKGPPPPDDY
jgi:hypothetical protein